MGITSSGKKNCKRKLENAYSSYCSQRFLNDIDLKIYQTEKIKNYLEKTKINGVLMGITYLGEENQNENSNDIKEIGYYSFYFFSNEKNRYKHGIVLEISNGKNSKNFNHIFQYIISNGHLNLYGLDYDQYLFQRASISLVETNSRIFETKNITIKYILKNLDIEIKYDGLDNVSLSKLFAKSICKLLNLSIENAYDVIPSKNVPKGINIISKEVLKEMNGKSNEKDEDYNVNYF